MSNHEVWLNEVLPRHERLTKAVSSILENLLDENNIEYLAVTGRTKDIKSATDKLTRKGYSDLEKQFTDLSGLRIVVYLESDLRRVCELIEESFEVDSQNSLDKKSLLAADRMGYRSVHYVCDLGPNRNNASEYKSLANLKFEIQVRTVLQHAWAELSHDRNYKFAGKLPGDLERKLYLYAGLLEIADKGFDETAAAIDAYSDSLRTRTANGDFDMEITSLSLYEFVRQWAEKNQFNLEGQHKPDNLTDLVDELKQFGISKISQLSEFADPEYARVASSEGIFTTAWGLVRDWMLLKDWRRFVKEVDFVWVMEVDESSVLQSLMDKEDYAQMISYFEERNKDIFEGDEEPDD